MVDPVTASLIIGGVNLANNVWSSNQNKKLSEKQLKFQKQQARFQREMQKKQLKLQQQQLGLQYDQQAISEKGFGLQEDKFLMDQRTQVLSERQTALGYLSQSLTAHADSDASYGRAGLAQQRADLSALQAQRVLEAGDFAAGQTRDEGARVLGAQRVGTAVSGIRLDSTIANRIRTNSERYISEDVDQVLSQASERAEAFRLEQAGHMTERDALYGSATALASQASIAQQAYLDFGGANDLNSELEKAGQFSNRYRRLRKSVDRKTARHQERLKGITHNKRRSPSLAKTKIEALRNTFRKADNISAAITKSPTKVKTEARRNTAPKAGNISAAITSLL